MSGGVSLVSGLVKGLGSRVAGKRSAHHRRLLSCIDSFEPELQQATEGELRRRSRSLRYRARSGEPLDTLLPEAFAMMREAARRCLGQRHYDVQLLGGIAIHNGSIAEMQTGEGKTLTATLPIYLAALVGRGAHLATANDYLAVRDLELMRPAYELLGMTAGVVDATTPRSQRRKAYACDITYGTAKEFGFDFLRDRLFRPPGDAGPRNLLGTWLGTLHASADMTVQRELHFALVDEADSILIDEARTPLIVSSTPGEAERVAARCYQWAAECCAAFQEKTHYDYDSKTKAVTLNADGRRLVRTIAKPSELLETPLLDLYEHLECALKVNRDFIRDRQYVIRDDEIVIVDEFTGRLAEGRKWREGIHQAVEAKEGVTISVKTGEAARITIQDYFRRYKRLGGMTGTATNSEAELKKIYDVQVEVIPTNRPPRRERLPARVFVTADQKWTAIVDEIRELHAIGRPVLIGTRSIDKSELLSRRLSEAGIAHQLLNARQTADEAEIVAQAGQLGRVTVATNMAGRGTDIRLPEESLALGGLHVICSELHESPRIDRQLIGRCGRQGDPGSYRQFMALDDEILRVGWGPRRAAQLLARGAKENGELASYVRYFRQAQNRVAREHFRQRRLLLYHERERKKLQEQMGQDPYLDAAS